MAVSIRTATDADIEAIASLQNAFIATTTIEWTEVPHSVESRIDWLADHPVCLVAEEDGEVVGLAAYSDFRDSVARPGYRFVCEDTVHVRESHWGTGVGRQLMAALIAEARRNGKHAMVAAVDGENEGSIRFHERLGFVEVARMPQVGEKFGRWLDLVLLQLTLDDRPSP